MKFFEMLRNSARELKSLRCLTVTGILIAIYVVLNIFIAFNTAQLKITFGYLALATIAMFYGPVVAGIAAVPCDLLTALGAGLGISFFYTPNKILEGFIYGILLYGLKLQSERKLNIMQLLKLITARVIVVALCYMTYNTLVNYYVFGVSPDSFQIYFTVRLIKNLIQLPVDIVLMVLLMPATSLVYHKVIKERRHS